MTLIVPRQLVAECQWLNGKIFEKTAEKTDSILVAPGPTAPVTFHPPERCFQLDTKNTKFYSPRLSSKSLVALTEFRTIMTFPNTWRDRTSPT